MFMLAEENWSADHEPCLVLDGEVGPWMLIKCLSWAVLTTKHQDLNTEESVFELVHLWIVVVY